MSLPGSLRICNASWSTNRKKGTWQIGKLASEHPDITFVLCGRYEPLPDIPNICLLGHLDRKGIAYECGIEPESYTPVHLNIRYYIFAILFLIFDVEAVFLFPWAVVFLELKSIPAVFYEMLLFIAILFFGILYGWRKGALQWR